MRNWTAKAVCAGVGLALGFAMGYALYLVGTFAHPVLARVRPSGNGFSLVFEGAARLVLMNWLLRTLAATTKIC
jgi:hypothetical protein